MESKGMIEKSKGVVEGIMGAETFFEETKYGFSLKWLWIYKIVQSEYIFEYSIINQEFITFNKKFVWSWSES